MLFGDGITEDVNIQNVAKEASNYADFINNLDMTLIKKIEKTAGIFGRFLFSFFFSFPFLFSFSFSFSLFNSFFFHIIISLIIIILKLFRIEFCS